MNILDNPWVIGIVGGLISGVIVYFVTNFFLNKKENKVYRQKINLANTEILHSIKPMINDVEKLNKDYFLSVRNAVSVKHNVNIEDLYNIEVISDSIICEIMQSQFLSYNQKKKYCNLILEFRNTSELKIKEKIEVIRNKASSSVTSKYLSIIISLMTVMFSILSIIIIEYSNLPLSIDDTLVVDKLGFFSAIIAIPMMSILMTQILFLLRKRSKKIIQDKNKTINKDEENDK